MKVLFVIDGLDEGGGSERSLIELLPRLASAGVKAQVACLKVPPDPYGTEQLEGLDVRLLAHDRVGRLLQLGALVRAEQPDLIHTSLFESDLVGRMAALTRRTPVLTSLVNTTYDPIRLGDPRVSASALHAVQIVDRLTARHLTSHFHAVSHAVKASAVATLGLPPERITVVERGRDSARLGEPSPARRRRSRDQLGLSDKDEVLVSVGRQTYQKGHIFLLRALAGLAAARPRLVWLLAGAEGDTTAELASMREALGLDGRVRYLGLRNDVGDVLAAADVFVHPSLYEGLPGAVLEAMALGLPVVASDIAPIREVVEADRTALLVPPSSPAELTTAITAILNGPARAAAFGTRARQVFLERYTAEQSSTRMVSLLERVASAAARHRRRWSLTPPVVANLED